jgi:hypothetical protein
MPSPRFSSGPTPKCQARLRAGFSFTPALAGFSATLSSGASDVGPQRLAFFHTFKILTCLA